MRTISHLPTLCQPLARADTNFVRAHSFIALMQCAPKPEGDPYGFTQFALKLNDCEGVNPLPSDSRRRPDRAQVGACTRVCVSVLLDAQLDAQRLREPPSDGCSLSWATAATRRWPSTIWRRCSGRSARCVCSFVRVAMVLGQARCVCEKVQRAERKAWMMQRE